MRNIRFEADIQKLQHPDLWGDATPVESLEDFFSVTVHLDGEKPFKKPTHLFGESIHLIPYHDEDAKMEDAAGNHFGRGDAFLSEVFGPGEIGFQLKHRRPQNRLLKRLPDTDAMKQHLKLQDTHVGLMIGVPDREGAPGVVSLHNPQTYDKGRFGRDEVGYSMILFKPVFPDYVDEEKAKLFSDNIRTMMVGFNTVSNYPCEEYDGADPLGACDVESVRELSRQMVLAVSGDDNQRQLANEWFKLPDHLIYCSELAHVSASAGLHCPLNSDTFVPLVGKEVWDRFVEHVHNHNQGLDSPFKTRNQNPQVKHIPLSIAPEALAPLPDYAPEHTRKSERAKLAFQPLTSEELISESTEILTQANQTWEPMKFVNHLCPEFLEGFREREKSAEKPSHKAATLFVPPSLLHLIAIGKKTSGLLGLDYAGHGLHVSLVRQIS